MNTDSSLKCRLERFLPLACPLDVDQSCLLLGSIDGTTDTEQVSHQAAHLLPIHRPAQEDVLCAAKMNFSAPKCSLSSFGDLAEEVRSLVMMEIDASSWGIRRRNSREFNRCGHDGGVGVSFRIPINTGICSGPADVCWRAGFLGGDGRGTAGGCDAR